MKQKWILVLMLFMVGIPAAFPMASRKPVLPPPALDQRFEGSLAAPEFPDTLEWLNTDHKLPLSRLKGKVVLLDFWTYCCINCIHVIPELKKLEAKYPNELVVIGVHSAKFLNERGTDSIRQAILRYEIKHPVLNDKDTEVWNAYGIQSWPTLVLINPVGKVIGVQSGEDIFEIFDGLIAQTIQYFNQKGQLDQKPLRLVREESKQPETLLSFPGKIRADRGKNLLFVTDSNHHRILISSPEGKVQEVIGSGLEGRKDGRFENAEFHHPQGVFIQGDLVYIADTENHLIREANLKTREVRTLFGTGEKARQSGLRGVGTRVPLSSPWDLLAYKDKLYIAMAGFHQIYSADLKTLEIQPYAGSGREGRVDGPLLEAALAQPSGITTNGSQLFFADSETSSVRSADLPSPYPLPEGGEKGVGNVETIIGEDLFEFGDIDGSHPTARLQHALGVEFDENQNQLYAADTYNSKIKVINPFKKTSQTFAGTGKHGYQDGRWDEARFYEPGGLTLLGDHLFIADTNNHQIRVMDIKTKQVLTLTLSGLEKVARSTVNPFKGRTVEMKPLSIKEGKGTVNLLFRLPKGYHFNEEAPFYVEWRSGGRNVTFTSQSNVLDRGRFSEPIQIPVVTTAGKEDLNFEAIVYYCRDSSKVCLFDHMRIHVPAKVKKNRSSNDEYQS